MKKNLSVIQVVIFIAITFVLFYIFMEIMCYIYL